MSKIILMHICVFTLAGFILVWPQLCFSQNPSPDEIIKRVKEYEDAYNRNDYKAAAAIYAKEGSHTYAFGITHHGRQEIESGLMQFFEGPFKGTKVTLKPEIIRFPANDLAVEEASFILEGMRMPDGTSMPPIHGFCLGIYQKQGNEWFIYAIQCMVPPPQ